MSSLVVCLGIGSKRRKHRAGKQGHRTKHNAEHALKAPSRAQLKPGNSGLLHSSHAVWADSLTRQAQKRTAATRSNVVWRTVQKSKGGLARGKGEAKRDSPRCTKLVRGDGCSRCSRYSRCDGPRVIFQKQHVVGPFEREITALLTAMARSPDHDAKNKLMRRPASARSD